MTPPATTPTTPLAATPRSARSARALLRALLRTPFRARTYRHLGFALCAPLGALLLYASTLAMHYAATHGAEQAALLILLAALLLTGLLLPAFDRLRIRWFFGEHLHGPATFRRGAAHLLTGTLLSALTATLTLGWALVSARNLSYPLWGWRSYPDPAWGGPTPLGVVTTHFLGGGLTAFFLLPPLVVWLTGRQLALARRLITAAPLPQ
ncbi:hypothetical protein ACFC6L_30145 [Kitasatospora phosalacinea]|uniref:hypothetical protein n=1 Tax=Kitasatospora phosalacinea TaxID=2065 RepID=UPI0035D637FA